MAYEIDFIGVSSEKSKQDADAIAIRWIDKYNKCRVVVYDGGLQAHGEALSDHLRIHYFNGCSGTVDAVVVSHSDQDHTSGLVNVLENFSVKELYMNRPWLYAEELFRYVNDGRITVDSLKKRLQEKYQYIYELEKVASAKGIPILEVFQGRTICEELMVLSPSRNDYKKLLVESEKTPLESRNAQNFLYRNFSNVFDKAKNLLETWDIETLRENEVVSAENEMSTIIMGRQGFLLVGDAGIRALTWAMDYADLVGYSIRDIVNFYQIPHHGGRHNVSPSILNRLIGNKVARGNGIGKTAFASVAEDSDHPLQMVVNAYIRRGASVYKTQGNILWHNNGMPARCGFGPALQEEFNNYVEDWND